MKDVIRLAYRFGVIKTWQAHPWKATAELRTVKTEGAFELHVWDYMREYFTSGDVGGFIDAMAGEIDNQWTRAWNEGARAAGVEPGEMEEADLVIIEQQIQTEIEFVLGLAEDIDQSIVDGLTDEEFNKRFSHRPPMWANRYNAIVDEARLHFETGKVKYEWILGDTSEHCISGEKNPGSVGCTDLAGIVMWGTEWSQVDILPQGDKLDCRGFNCACRLEVTDKRRTSGGLTRVLDLMTASGL